MQCGNGKLVARGRVEVKSAALSMQGLPLLLVLGQLLQRLLDPTKVEFAAASAQALRSFQLTMEEEV